MIDSRGLRLGNWVYFDGKATKVIALHGHSASLATAFDSDSGKEIAECNQEADYGDILPLPISESAAYSLLGLELRQGDYAYLHTEGKESIEFLSFKGYVQIQSDSTGELWAESIHELQNILAVVHKIYV